MKIVTVNASVPAETNIGLRSPIATLLQKSHVFDANLQKELLLEYKRNSKIKSQEYTKFLADKKDLITIIFGQCDEATKTKIAYGTTYTADRQTERIIELFN